MTVSFIYFDLGKVLLDFTHERGFQQIADVAGISSDEVRAAMVDTGLADQYETGLVSTAEFHQQFCALTKTSAGLQELSEAWGNIFELKSDTVAIVAGLRATGHRIGILSNTCAAHWEYAVRRFPMLNQCFDPVITSYEEHSMKPAKAIYEAAAKQAQVPPHEIFFTDDRAENVEGARAQGWQSEIFTSALQLANDLERHGVVFNR